MSLEAATYISDLNPANPTAADPKSQGDDHVRLIKYTIKYTFPNVAGAMNATHTELNYVVGVTSSIQSQFNSITSTLLPAKSFKAGDAYSGTHDYTGASVLVATPTLANQPATKAYADGLAFALVLPAQAGNANKGITTDGTTARWAAFPGTGYALAGITLSKYTRTNSIQYNAHSVTTLMLSPTLGLLITDAGSAPQTSVTAFRLDAGRLVFGASINISTDNGNYLTTACALTSTRAFVSYYSTAGGGVMANTLDVNASTLVITANTASQVGYGGNSTACTIDSSHVLLVYADSSTNMHAVVITVNASTVTKGTAVQIDTLTWGTSNGAIASVVQLTAGLYHLVYVLSSPSYVQRITVSGTTPAGSTPVALSATKSSVTQLYRYDNVTSFAALVDTSTNSVNALKLTDSGSAVTPTDTQIYQRSMSGGLAAVASASNLYTFAPQIAGQELYAYNMATGAVTGPYQSAELYDIPIGIPNGGAARMRLTPYGSTVMLNMFGYWQGATSATFVSVPATIT